MKPKILLTEKIHSQGMEILSSAGNLLIAPNPSENTIIDMIGDAEALVVRSSMVTAKIIEAGKRLRVIGKHGIGVDNLDLNACASKGVIVVNTPEANVISVAEHVVTCMLTLCKRLQQADRALRTGVFDQPGSLPGLVTKLGYSNMELYGKSLGLIGVGKIGQRLANICIHGFGMKVYGYNRSPIKCLGVIPCTTIDELVSQSDFVSINVPLTENTKGIINAKVLEKMKPTAFLINSARGGVVDEQDLFDVLKQRKIAGAAVDVFEKEPPRQDHPFFRLDNILVTPHIAAMTDEALYRMAVDVANDVVTVLNGEKPKNCFNMDVFKK